MIVKDEVVELKVDGKIVNTNSVDATDNKLSNESNDSSEWFKNVIIMRTKNLVNSNWKLFDLENLE